MSDSSVSLLVAAVLLIKIVALVTVVTNTPWYVWPAVLVLMVQVEIRRG